MVMMEQLLYLLIIVEKKISIFNIKAGSYSLVDTTEKGYSISIDEHNDFEVPLFHKHPKKEP